MTTPIKPPTLSSLLFLPERKDRALSIISQLESGFLVTKSGQQLSLSNLSLEEFIREFSAMTGMESIKSSGGYFSTAIVDLGAGSVECVIKFGFPFNDTGWMGWTASKSRSWKNDYFWNYAVAAKEVGGKTYATPLPAIYHISTLNLANDTQLPVCIMEFVAVERNKHLGKMLERVLDKAFVALKLPFDEAVNTLGSDPMITPSLEQWKWTPEDLMKFCQVVSDVTNGSALFDLSEGTNSGWRSDGSLCVFDPLGLKSF